LHQFLHKKCIKMQKVQQNAKSKYHMQGNYFLKSKSRKYGLDWTM